MPKNPLIIGSTVMLTSAARDLFHQVGIHVKKTINVRVLITQRAALGVSFEFLNSNTDKEFHIPARMITECFN